jgi:purine/pyrimidine-nucleoside phosphorylase
MLNVNQYFEGKVMSIGYQSSDGPATMGVMDVGEYEFSTSKQEHMTVITGELAVKLPKQTSFRKILPNETFVVEANQTFQVKSLMQTSYLCLYK